MTHLRRYLEQTRALPQHALETALRRQQIYGGSLDTVLLELELCDAETLAEFLTQACGLPIAPVAYLADGFERPWSAIPREFVEVGSALPLLRDGARLFVAVHPDLPNDQLGALYRALRGVEPVVVPECVIEKLAAERRGVALSHRHAGLFRRFMASMQRRPSASDVGFAILPDVAPEPSPDAGAVPSHVERDRTRSISPTFPTHGPVTAPPTGSAALQLQTVATLDEDELIRRMAGARALLESARERDAALDALVQAVGVMSPRIALFRIKHATRATDRVLEGHRVARTALHDVADLTVATATDPALAAALEAGRWLGPTPASLCNVLRLEAAVPCMLARIDVAHRPVLLVYVDHGGRTFSSVETNLLAELATVTGHTLEHILAMRRRAAVNQAPVGVAPHPQPVRSLQAVDGGRAQTPARHEDAAPIPPPPPMREPDAKRRHDTLMGLPAADHAEEPSPDAGEPETATIVALAEPLAHPVPVGAVRGQIALDDDDWSRAPAERCDDQRRQIELALRRICEGKANISVLEPFGDAGIAQLAAVFPGPLEVLRRDLRSLPPPSAHGPLVRAAVTLAGAVVPHVLGLFDHPDADVRFYAALLFQELRDARCIGPLAELAFDVSGDVRVVATRVLETYNRFDGFAASIALVREQLASSNRTQQLHATRAVGTLRDVEAIARLIELLASKDRSLQEAALESLCSITGQQHGLKPHRWRQWYLEQGHRHRIEWIIESLRHRDLPVRRWACDELVRVTGHRVPFSPLGDRKAREVAIRAWTDWWETVGRGRFGAEISAI